MKPNPLEFLRPVETIQVLDVGAARINETPIYEPLLDRDLAHLYACEGDDRQIANIKQHHGAKASIVSQFLGDGHRHELYLASPASGMTSLLKPDPRALKFFNGFEAIGAIREVRQVATQRLDDAGDIPPIDFLKMDIQGSELALLENGPEKLKHCVAIQLEVSFIPLYQNQPTLGVLDQWLRARGFAPHCFLDIKRWSIFPTVFNNDVRVPGNQLLEGDMVYVRDPLSLQCLSEQQLKKLALIAHFSLKSVDLCAHFLFELMERKLIHPESHLIYFNNCNRGQSRE